MPHLGHKLNIGLAAFLVVASYLVTPAYAGMTVGQFLQLPEQSQVAVVAGVMEALQTWAAFLGESKSLQTTGVVPKAAACLAQQRLSNGEITKRVREMLMFAIGRDASFATDRDKMDIPTMVLGTLADCR